LRQFWVTFLQAFNNFDCRRRIERRALCREAESYMSHHETSKHQCTSLGSVPNLNSQANSPLTRDESFQMKYENRRSDVISLNQPRDMLACIDACLCRDVTRSFRLQDIEFFAWFAFYNHSCKKLAEMSVKNDASGGVEK